MPTTLCLVRHGRAASPSRDADLLPEGERQIRALGRRLAGEGFSPVAAASSPYTRAHRTARLLLSVVAPRLEPALLDQLLPEADAEAALDAVLSGGAPLGRVLVVAHMPLLGHLAMRLAGEDPGFSPGTLVEIEISDDVASGRLVRRLGPEDLET